MFQSHTEILEKLTWKFLWSTRSERSIFPINLKILWWKKFTVVIENNILLDLSLIILHFNSNCGFVIRFLARFFCRGYIPLLRWWLRGHFIGRLFHRDGCFDVSFKLLENNASFANFILLKILLISVDFLLVIHKICRSSTSI